MTAQEFRENVRFVRRRSSRLTKAAIFLAVVFATVALLVVHALTLNLQEQAQNAKDQAQQLEQENDRLEDKIENLGSLEGVEDIAKDELGLVDPDTVIIEPEN